ncbi:hypothetical protein WSM22_04520 [Cytophagales bacterium WSM2-2]|nr:hypothetical protein WSM22_04520 [Cytophagales bacterium WSM2-2]
MGVGQALAQPTFTIIPGKDACGATAPTSTNGSFTIHVTNVGDITLTGQAQVSVFGPTSSTFNISAIGDYLISNVRGNGTTNNYQVTIIDDNGDFLSVFTTVKFWSPPSASLTSKTDVTTCTPVNGAIDITPSGGSGAYTYVWTGPGGFVNPGTQDLNTLGPGNYSVTVSDANTVCTGSLGPITINIASPSITLGAIPSVCTGTTSSTLSYSGIVGGVDEYMIDWDATANAAGLGDVGLGALPGSPIPINGIPAVVTTTTFNGTFTGKNSGSGCFTAGMPISVTVNANNTITLSSAAGTDSQTKCINTAITNITYATTGATGATFSGLPAGVTGNWAANVVTISGSPTTTVGSPFNYTVTMTGGCTGGTNTATGTITVTPDNTISLTSAAGTNAQTVCINTAITDITYGTTGATGATFSGLPAGVTGNWAANVVTISGTPTTAVGSPFGYTVTLTGGCGNITATGTITVSPNNTISLTSAAGTNAQTACINTAITDITYGTTGATGATFSGLPAGVTGNWAANVVTISGTPTTTVGSPFGYTVTLTGGCGNITATGTITVAPNNTISLTSAAGTDSQTKCINTAITNITYATTGATGATFSGLPAGVTGNWAANVVTISGSPTTTVGSPFNYTVTMTGGCTGGTNTATGTITVTPDNTINLTSAAGTNAQTVCINTAITDITYGTTGATGATFSGLPTGVTGNWAANVVTISGTPTTAVGSPFNYTVTLTGGCGNITATGTITVTPDNTISLTSVAGTNAQTVCINTAITNITYTTTGATGATFSGLPAGVTGNWAANVVTISGTPTTTVGSPFGYTVTLTGGCGNITATGTITVTPDNTITLSSAAGTDSQTKCVNTAITNITYTTTGATGATFSGLPAGVTGNWAANVVTISGTPTTAVGSPFNYTVTLTGGCGNITATGTITVTPDNTITLSSAAGTDSQTKCINTAITNITYTTTGATGATFSGLPAGVTGNWAANVVTISGTPTTAVGSPFGYTVTLTGGCGNITATGTITVTPDNTITLSSAAGTDSQTACINTAITNITYTTTGATGATFSGLPTGVTGNWVANVVTISGTPTTTVGSPFNYTVTLTGGCGNITATGTITVTVANTITLSSAAGTDSQTKCINTAITNITYTTTGATGAMFSGLPTGVTGNWAANVVTISGTPTTAVGSPFGYTVTLTGGCGNITATGTITVTPDNTITLSSAAGTDSQTKCINTAITNITYTTTGATGATFSGLPTGVTGNWAANVVTISGTPTTAVGSPFGYTVTLTGGCGNITATGTITVTPDNTITLSSAAGTDSQTACINTAITDITYTTTGATGATFSGLPTGVTGNWAANVVTISGTPTTAVGSPFGYTVTLTGGCGNITATGTITVTVANTITLSSAAGTDSQTKCINTAITNITYTTTGATGATFSGLPAGVTGNWAANVVTISGTPTTAVGSPFGYTVTLTGGCGNITATGTITVTPDNTITLSSAAGTDSQTACINTAITDITYTTTGATGATFSGLPTGVTGNWAANVVTISGTPTTTVGSPFGYTVTLTGGCGNITATGTITVTVANTITLSSAAGTDSQTKCINTAITNITYTTTGATGATFSGLPTGVTGNWAANVVTISGTPTTTVGSPFGYTVTLTGGCGNITATGTITVTPDNTITLSSAAGTDSQTKCVSTAITNITYTTTGATGATFSGLPAGVTGNWAANVVTISGTPTTAVGSPFNYTVTLTGGCGNITATGTINVNPLPVPTTINKTDASCTGANNGSIDIAVVSGTAGPWDYSITGGTSPQGTSLFSNLATGNYSVVVKDQITGCSSTPVPVTINATVAIIPTIAKTDASCNGVSNGQISITAVTGGAAPYQYSINNGSAGSFVGTSVFSNLAGASNYSVVVKDNSGCLSTVNTIFVANTNTISGTVNKTDASSCIGNNGSIQITSPSGGTAPYNYSIDNGANFFPTSTFGTLVPGNYNVVIRDAGLCKSSAIAVTIGTISNIVPVIGKTDASCAGKTDGSISITSVTGGTAPYTYSINNGAAGTFAAAGVTTFSNLAGNSNFSVVAKDANGCLSSAISIIINNTISITGSLAKTDASCAGNDGTITANSPSGGTGPYTYSLDAGTFQAANNFAGVSVGSHTVVIKDANTCQSSSLSITINSSSNISPTISKTDATCNGKTDGSITISSVSGGVGPYTYSIDNGATPFQVANSFTNLAAGNYSILVKDASNCVSSVFSVTLSNTTTISGTVSKTDETCTGGDGIIQITNPVGGTAPYQYAKDGVTFVVGNTFNNLGTASFPIVIKDNIGCLSTAVLTSISLPTNCSGGGGGGGGGACATVVIVPQPTAATCTNSDGKIVFNITPAVPAVNNTGVKITITGTSSTNLTISSTNFNNFTFNNLPIGTYSYSIEYGDPACTKTGQVTIDQSGTIGTPVASNIVNATCFGTATGAVTLDVPGETGNLLEWSIDGVSWATFTAGNQIAGIPAGTGVGNQRVISVRRNSSDPCFAAVTVAITQPADIVISSITTDASCANNDGSAQISSVSGGTGSTYTYQFDGSGSTGLSFTKLSGGAHTFTVTDANSCVKNFPLTVNYPGLVLFTVNPTNPDCFGSGNNGSVDATITSSGNFDVGITTSATADPNVFQTVISTGSTVVTFPGLSKGTYYVVAKPSGALCPSKMPVMISGGPTAVDFTISTENFVCFETKGNVDVLGVKGSNAVDYGYEILSQGSVVQSDLITQLQVLDTVQLTNLGEGDYQIRLFQDQSAATGCTTPITSAYKNFTIKGPAASLDTLYIHTYPSTTNAATGSMMIGIKESQEPSYKLKIQLLNPFLSGQNNKHNGFDSLWTKANLNSLNFVYEYDATNLYPGLYRVYLKDTLGCTRKYDITIDFNREIFIPNIFTPNNDTFNDNFEGINIPDDASVVITNRWGKQVYQSSDLKKIPNTNVTIIWNGGAETDGIYFYTLTTGSKVYTGWVELLHPTD